MRGSVGRALNGSAIECRVLWNQWPEFGRRQAETVLSLSLSLAPGHSQAMHGTFKRAHLDLKPANILFQRWPAQRPKHAFRV